MRSVNMLIMFVFSVLITVPKISTAKEKEPLFVASEMLVKFKSGKKEKGNKEIAKIGAKVKERLKTIDVSRLKLPKNLPVEKAVKQFSKLNIVEYAEPNFIQKAVWSPNDTYYSKQWGLDKIQATKGWGKHTGKSSTVIAIVDTGVDLDHPDLKKKLVKGYDFVDDDSTPDDVGGHGTHCAGIAAASSNNNKGVAGVCPNCSIMPVRVLGPNGGTATAVANGIVYAADHGAKVISLSLGSYQLSSTIKDALAHAENKGAVIVAAAGNDHVSFPHYPSYFEPCIAVGSTDKKDKQSSFSNYGAWVDVAAPGDQIYSTVPDGKYDYKSGTSMATPHVAGLAGLMFSCPGASQSNVKEGILNSTKSVGDWLTKGRVDVVKALDAVGCGDSASSDPPDTGTTPAPGKGTEGATLKVKLNHGKNVSNKDGALAASDDKRVSLASKSAGLSNYLDFIVETSVEKGKTYAGLKLTVEGLSDNPGKFEVHLFNWKKGESKKVSSIKLENSEKSVTVDVGNAGAYVDEKGRVWIKFIRKEKLWNGFDINLDYVSINGTAKATPPPKSSDPEPEKGPEKEKESLGDKAKKTWEKFKKKL